MPKIFFALRNLKLKIKNQSLYVITRRSRLKKKISRRSLNANENALGNQRKSWLLATILLTLLRKKRSMISVKSHVSTAIRKATMPTTVPSQKTSVGLGNLRAGD